MAKKDTSKIRKLRTRMGLRFLPWRQSLYSKFAWEGWDRSELYRPDVLSALPEYFAGTSSNVHPSDLPKSPLKSMLLLDQTGYLPDDLLLKTDYATMAHGLEARAPFLDHKLANVAAKLPDNLLICENVTKVALRRLAEKHLPPELFNRPKRGFSVPLKRWLRDDLHEWAADLIIHNSKTAGQYFNPGSVKRILAEHKERKKNRTRKIYTLLVFELWHRQYFG